MKIGTLVDMVGEGQLSAVTEAIALAIGISYDFDFDKARQTAAETKRRFELCLKVFGILRGDAKWSTSRCIDHLAGYLRAELDGIKWEPSKRACWMPGDRA